MTTQIHIAKLTRTHCLTDFELTQRKITVNTIILRRMDETVDHDFLHLFSP